MARYRAKALLFVDRLLTTGEEFSSDLPPGLNWEPLDADARAAVAKRFPRGAPETASPGIRAAPMTAIPENWRELPTPQVITLAIRLGAPRKGTTRPVAEKHIENEIAQRGLTAPERAREAA